MLLCFRYHHCPHHDILRPWGTKRFAKSALSNRPWLFRVYILYLHFLHCCSGNYVRSPPHSIFLYLLEFSFKNFLFSCWICLGVVFIVMELKVWCLNIQGKFQPSAGIAWLFSVSVCFTNLNCLGRHHFDTDFNLKR